MAYKHNKSAPAFSDVIVATTVANLRTLTTTLTAVCTDACGAWAREGLGRPMPHPDFFFARRLRSANCHAQSKVGDSNESLSKVFPGIDLCIHRRDARACGDGNLEPCEQRRHAEHRSRRRRIVEYQSR